MLGLRFVIMIETGNWQEERGEDLAHGRSGRVKLFGYLS